jgi:flagellar motor switch protein FliN/FliY
MSRSRSSAAANQLFDVWNLVNTPTKEIESRRSPQLVELSEFSGQAHPGPNVPGSHVLASHLGLFGGVKVRLTVVVGEVQTTLGALMELKESAILKIDRPVDYPVDVLVDGNLVATGQLVVVDESFGVRITEIAAKTTP